MVVIVSEIDEKDTLFPEKVAKAKEIEDTKQRRCLQTPSNSR